MRNFALLACFLVAISLPALAFDASDYRFVKRIGECQNTGPLFSLELDSEVYATARGDLADLRIECDGNAEVPYLLGKKT
ncbi:MAG: hypothetical protein HQL31_05735, partial [Planctomycetes bacterium]|nr:hypothetical protein [Planctomycetota bacterium]